MFDKIWRPWNIRSETSFFFVLVFDGRCFVRLESRVSNMFEAGMRTTLAQRFVSIVDQTCFNRLATHFNIGMYVWWCLVAKHFSFVQALRLRSANFSVHAQTELELERFYEPNQIYTYQTGIYLKSNQLWVAPIYYE